MPIHIRYGDFGSSRMLTTDLITSWWTCTDVYHHLMVTYPQRWCFIMYGEGYRRAKHSIYILWSSVVWHMDTSVTEGHSALSWAYKTSTFTHMMCHLSSNMDKIEPRTITNFFNINIISAFQIRHQISLYDNSDTIRLMNKQDNPCLKHLKSNTGHSGGWQ
jgi:hypothetical protein